jgi:hypothetical protein
MYNEGYMRRTLFVAIVSLLTVGLFLPFTGATAQAEDLTPDQANLVKTNCVSIKNSLTQLHASDALLRVNRGQIYESMGTKLMDTFNDRLASNRLDNKAMSTVTTNYRSALTTFRTDYIAYEQKLSSVLRIDCMTQPNTFHTGLEEARILRATVHEDVMKLHRLIDDYRSSVSSFLLNYERLSE